MPIHDTAFAYSWLIDNLAPENPGRRDIYVYGSHLGASLATSLSLTEAHAHARFGIRGVVAYNGIYNWVMFLPDHRINRPSKRTKSIIAPLRPAEGSYLHNLQEQMPELFDTPSNLFDPFASPSLFFHNPGVEVPESFILSASESAAIDALVSPDDAPTTPTKALRKAHYIFPPRKSTLKVPETLLLYNSAVSAPQTKSGRGRRAKAKGNSLGAQAGELAEMMRRSINKAELKERSRWDEEIDSWNEEAFRRVQVVELGEEKPSVEMDEAGEEAVREWLEERTKTRR